MSNEIMNIMEIAEFLQVKAQIVYRLVQQDKIPALKIGGQWKVKKSHLDNMFDDMLNKTISNMDLKESTLINIKHGKRLFDQYQWN